MAGSVWRVEAGHFRKVRGWREEAAKYIECAEGRCWGSREGENQRLRRRARLGADRSTAESEDGREE